VHLPPDASAQDGGAFVRAGFMVALRPFRVALMGEQAVKLSSKIQFVDKKNLRLVMDCVQGVLHVARKIQERRA